MHRQHPPPQTRSRSKNLWGLFAGCLILGFLPLSASATDGMAIVAALEKSFSKIIEDAEPSVVSIARYNRFHQREMDRSGEGNRMAPEQKPASLEDYVPSEFGAGVVIAHPEHADKHLILTMYHVVKGGPVAGRDSATDELVIRTHNRRSARAEILAADPRSDLAVLRIKPGESLKPADLKPIPLAKNPSYRKGQFVITLGNPYAIARDGSVCAGWGMLSNIARRPQPVALPTDNLEKRKRETVHHLGTLLQIDANLNLGTSGGTVLNRQGELIGLVTAMAALEGYEKSVGYAVPITDHMQRIITELANGYEVEYGLLGIQPETKNFPVGEQPTAVHVGGLVSRSPAAQAGIRQDDLIYAVNDIATITQEDLMREVALIGPNRIAKLQIYRPQTREWLSKNVRLTKWPVYNDEDIIATEHRYAWNNIHIDHATARYDFFGHQYRHAVLVTHIEGKEDKGFEQSSQLRAGDFITHVDNKAVTTPEEFMDAVKGKTGAVELRLVDHRKVTLRITD